MKRRFLMTAIVLALAAGTVFGFDRTMYPYTKPEGKEGAALNCVRAEAGMELELGKWYTNWEVCKEYADRNGIPLVAVWSNEGCSHCWWFDICLIQDEFKVFQKTEDAGRVIYCFMAGGGDDIDQDPSKGFNWMWKDGGKKLSSYPFVVFWWKAGNVNERRSGDAVRDVSMGDRYVAKGTTNVISKIRKAFKDWKPPAADSGAWGTHRQEVEYTTKSVSLELTRTGATAATAGTVKIVSSTNNAVVLGEVRDVTWQEGQTSQTVVVDLTGKSLLEAAKDGDTFDVQAEAGVTVVPSNVITCVKRPASVHNPLWIGERTTDTLAFGEWTMDFATATNKVASCKEEAFTLAMVSGSLWCPDCEKTAANFLEVRDGNGRNRFDAWASSNNVALVEIDVPRFGTSDAGEVGFDVSTYPSLLIREARDGWLDPRTRSGLGYLTRKGATDEEANAVLVRNHALVTTPTAQGGFNRAENENPLRTGVPMVVLLRKDGSVAARLTRWWSVSPTSSSDWDAHIERFNEMLAMARTDSSHADDIENNDARTTRSSLNATGTCATNELSHVDPVDVFRLEGFKAGVPQHIAVRGLSSDDATVIMSLLRRQKESADKANQVAGASATGSLKNGIAITNAVFESGYDYYVSIVGQGSTATTNVVDTGAFGIRNTNSTFRQYEVLYNVFTPQEKKKSGICPNESGIVTLEVEAGQLYRLTGFEKSELDTYFTQDETDAEMSTAKTTGVIRLRAPRSGSFDYQRMNPGVIEFTKVTDKVEEGAGDWEYVLSIARKNGTSGDVDVRVEIDEMQTDFHSDDDMRTPRFAFTPIVLTWKDGEAHTTNVVLRIKGDSLYDGDGTVVLKMAHVKGAAKLGANTTFTLTVHEEDTKSVGKAAFVGVEPYYVKAKTVYVKAGKTAMVKVGRIQGGDGSATVRVKASPSSVTLSSGVDVNGVVSWGNRKIDEKTVTVHGLKVGTTTLTLADASDGFKIVSASNTVKIVAVAADAPEFAASTTQSTATRYVAFSNAYPVVSVPDGTKKLTFTKLSGTLPAGLKAVWDPTAAALVIQGVSTAKAGVYTPVYQVKADRTAGLTLALTITVVDLTKQGADGTAALNPALAKARTFNDIPVLAAAGDSKRLVGLLKITVPPTGRVSAKLTTAEGTQSFSSPNWTEVADDGTASTTLTMRKSTRSMTVAASPNGSLAITVLDDGEMLYEASTDGGTWSKTESAEAWAGYYTVALPVDVERVAEDDSRPGFAPRGTGYMTLKMDTAAAWNAGRMTWAGMLPNGTTLSGRSTLEHVNADEVGVTTLPILSQSSRDVLSVYAQIESEQVSQGVRPAAGVVSVWNHTERQATAKADYSVELGVHGGPFDSADLAGCCSTDYGTELVLQFATDNIVCRNGTLGVVDDTKVTVEETALTLDSEKPVGLTLTLARKTGVVQGQVRIPVGEDGETTVFAKWRGVLLQGFGEDCDACGPGGQSVEKVVRPFLNGSYFFSDVIEYLDAKGRTRTLSVKRGGDVHLDKAGTDESEQ